jgi:threonine dehydratase
MPLSLDAIAEADRLVDPVFRNSPQFECEPLSDALGVRMTVKVECCNPIRSFKGRGTDYLMHRLQRLEEPPRRLVTASAGNFGQGLAHAARRRGVPLTVFASTAANPLKVDRMRALGAQVRIAGDDFDAAKAEARDHALREGATFVEDGALPAIAEGAGTIAVELCRQAGELETVLVPVGNGALVNGIGTWLKAHAPAARVVGVCASAAPAMERSWRTGTVVTTERADTIADGIAVRVPVPEALEQMRDTVDEMVTAPEELLLHAMRLCLQHLGLVVEPAGAAGVAACLLLRDRLAGGRVATPLCGGNLTPEQIDGWLR